MKRASRSRRFPSRGHQQSKAGPWTQLLQKLTPSPPWAAPPAAPLPALGLRYRTPGFGGNTLHVGLIGQLVQRRLPVLRFRLTRWDHWSRMLEIVTGELLTDQPVPVRQAQPSAK